MKKETEIKKIRCISCHKTWVKNSLKSYLKMCYPCGLEWMKQQSADKPDIGWETNL